ncbi:envelope-like protein, partial [Trifolium medium]|nr:envelope-like protein [Trifolium medium]
MPIVFPTLICDITLAQYPGICTESDVPSRRESYLSLDYRLFEGTHAADIAAPFAQKPTGAITRQQMIADLKLV